MISGDACSTDRGNTESCAAIPLIGSAHRSAEQTNVRMALSWVLVSIHMNAGAGAKFRTVYAAALERFQVMRDSLDETAACRRGAAWLSQPIVVPVSTSDSER